MAEDAWVLVLNKLNVHLSVHVDVSMHASLCTYKGVHVRACKCLRVYTHVREHVSLRVRHVCEHVPGPALMRPAGLLAAGVLAILTGPVITGNYPAQN